MIELISWKTRLLLVGYRDRVAWQQYQAANSGPTDFQPLIRGLVNRLSPFDHAVGYRRQWLRLLLWFITHPLMTLRQDLLSVTLRLLSRIAPHVSPGRYEGMEGARALKAEWLDVNTELADQATGESEVFGLWAAVFTELNVPWSRKPEQWLLTVDSNGFTHATQEGVLSRFAEIESDYQDWLTKGA